MSSFDVESDVPDINKVTSITRKTDPADFSADLKQAEQVGAARLSIQEMCAIFDCTEEQFRHKRKNDKDFANALIRGKAKATQICANVILRAAQGDNSVTDTQVQAAKLYLEKQSGEWVKD